MQTTQTPEQEGFRAYTGLLLKLHELIANGGGDSEQADAIRDQMDEPWYAMADLELSRVRGLSQDLHALAAGGRKPVSMSPEQGAGWSRDARAVFEAFWAGDYDTPLAFLRRPFPSTVPPSGIPFLQARCWEGLGDLEAAVRFMREAERLDPHQAVCVLILLDKLGRTGEAAQYAGRILADEKSSPEELFLAAAALLLPARGLTGEEARAALESLVPPLNRALEGTRSIPPEYQDIPDLEPPVAYMLGFCYELLGKDPKAIEVYSGTLGRYPNNEELLTARGIARYEIDRTGALKDFERARRSGAVAVWPYYFLAHHALEQGNFLRCLRLCLEGLEHEAAKEVHAQLYEWVGICQSMLGQPRDIIGQAFNQAESLDPANSNRIRHNRELSEKGPSATTRKAQRWKGEQTVPIRQARNIRRTDINRLQDSLDEKRNGRAAKWLVPA